MQHTLSEHTVLVDGISVRYLRGGTGFPVLFLHGWGGEAESVSELAKHLPSDKFQLISPDFPGFGKTLPPEKPWTVQDYVTFIQHFLAELGIPSCLLMTHSFGGRVAIKWAAAHPSEIKGMALLASAGIKPPRNLKYFLIRALAWVGKKVFSLPILSSVGSLMKKILYRVSGSSDYQKTSGVMRETFRLVTEEDLRPLLPSIDLPVLLIWGDKDTQTPLSDGKIMEQEIPGAVLHVISDIRHRVHKDAASECIRYITPFFQKILSL